MEWYQNEKNLGNAVDFLIKFSCCYGWNAFVSDKTPCCNYKDGDKDIPQELRYELEKHLNNIPKEAYRNLNKEMSLLLGERFYLRKTAIIKILSRILVDGNPCENENTSMIEFALQMQIKQRIELLETLRVS